MYLHAAANGSRTYGRTGLKCQNGWHALCGMAPTLWPSIRHVDQHGYIMRRAEALPLSFAASCRRVGMVAQFTKFDRVQSSVKRDPRNRQYRGVWVGAAPVNAPAGARGQSRTETSVVRSVNNGLPQESGSWHRLVVGTDSRVTR